ncbi:MAG: hypothetical protein OEW04_04595, partial [Nitrospirota bacterium]|nr:hypothetical protein [Nitrospirota bacterium]
MTKSPMELRISIQVLLCRVILACVLVTGTVNVAVASHTDDQFIAGYATAVLEREFHISGATVRVE